MNGGICIREVTDLLGWKATRSAAHTLRGHPGGSRPVLPPLCEG